MKIESRLLGEPTRAFLAFQRYLSLGPSRSTNKLAADLDFSHSTVQSWSARYHWRARAEEYDLAAIEAEQGLRKKELEKSAIDWAARQAEIREAEWECSRNLIQLARQILRDPRVEYTAGDIANLLHLGSILGRRATGLSVTPEKEKPEKRLPWQHVSDEDVIRRINLVYGKTSKEDRSVDGNSQPATALHSVPNTEAHN